MPNRRNYYGLGDEKFIKKLSTDDNKHTKWSNKPYLFDLPEIYKRNSKYDPHDIPIAFKGAPESLLVLAAKVVDAQPLPDVYQWNIEDICRWLRNYGYPQYQNTFRENLINGHTLLLVDASALPAMNIKDFDHIKHIAYGIRMLYAYQLTKFGRNLSLPREPPLELYKLFRVKTGTFYDTTKCSDFLRRIHVLREPKKLYDHWEALENHLNMKRDPKYREIFGRYKRPYKNAELRSKKYDLGPIPCKCPSPCMCFWRTIAKFQDTPGYYNPTEARKSSQESTHFELLKRHFPQKYGSLKHIAKIFAMSETEVIKFRAQSSLA